MKYHAHLHTAVSLLEQYEGSPPFGIFLRSFFKANKKYGSADRKNITRFCYAAFRLGKALPDLAASERIIAGLFLTASGPDVLLAFFQPDWSQWLQENQPAAGPAKAAFLKNIYPSFDAGAVFPAVPELSTRIEKQSFLFSHWQQPDLFLRIRPGHTEAVIRRLTKEGIDYGLPRPDTVRLPNTFPADRIFDLDREVVVQDDSSQRVGSLMQAAIRQLPLHFSAWDCCAASGGKSILLCDLAPEPDLTVSDIRPSILANLKKRLAEAGIRRYRAFVADLTTGKGQPQTGPFDLIIADVPCSGSGTWSRTPEQLSFFRPGEIGKYSRLQQQIVAHTLPALRPGGYFLYITCSVFKKENEEIVEFLQDRFSLSLKQMEYFKGYDRRADTLFAALFRK